MARSLRTTAGSRSRSVPNEHTTEAKGGHRTIWMPYTAEDGRTFHVRHEDNGGIPGTYRGFSPDGGVTWTAMWMGPREDMDPPLRVSSPVPVIHAIAGLGWAKYAIFPDGWRAGRDERLDAARALVVRHAQAQACDRCGATDLRCGAIDARTVEERVYCVACHLQLEHERDRARVQYRQFECACGAMCYVQVKPFTRERSEYNDVLPCPKCGWLACAECLAEGAKACRGCVKTRRRRAA